MTTRRRFMETGVALSAVPWAALAALSRAEETRNARAIALERFVYDSRFPEAVEIARHVYLDGVRMSEIAGDLTDLWYRELDLLWKKTPVALAGVTTRQGLFVLETLAADHRMRVAYRGEHGIPVAGRVAHTLVGPPGLISLAKSEHDGAFSISRLATAILSCPTGVHRAATIDAVSPVEDAQRDEPLFSWIIAPASTLSLKV